jgi:hypothetical protein
LRNITEVCGNKTAPLLQYIGKPELLEPMATTKFFRVLVFVEGCQLDKGHVHRYVLPTVKSDNDAVDGKKGSSRDPGAFVKMGGG